MKRWMICPIGLAVAIGLGSATPAQGPMAAPAPPAPMGPDLSSGGVIPMPCPAPDEPTGVKDPNALPGGLDGAASTAEKIEKEEAEAEVRRAAVRYLGTVDCHDYPEAEKALIISLRTDRDECVRWEAALALGGGCCSTKKTIEALAITVCGSRKDGNPGEISPRVRVAACHSLERCLNHYQGCLSEDRTESQPGQPGVGLGAYYTEVEAKPVAQVFADARRVLAAASR